MSTIRKKQSNWLDSLNMGDGGKTKQNPPIYTTDKNKVQAYNDSLKTYNNLPLVERDLQSFLSTRPTVDEYNKNRQSIIDRHPINFNILSESNRRSWKNVLGRVYENEDRTIPEWEITKRIAKQPVQPYILGQEIRQLPISQPNQLQIQLDQQDLQQRPVEGYFPYGHSYQSDYLGKVRIDGNEQFGDGGKTKVNLPDTTSDKSVVPWQDWQKDLVANNTPDNFMGVANSGDKQLSGIDRMKTIQDSLQGVNYKNTINPDYGGTPDITLKTGNFNGARVNTALIDDLHSAAIKKGIDPYTLYGLAGQETTLGHNYYGPLGKTQQGSLSGWNTNEAHEPENPYRYLSEHGAPGIQVTKDKSGIYASPTSMAGEDSLNTYINNNPQLIDNYRKSQGKRVINQPTTPAELSIDYINRHGGVQGYNPGDPDYSNKVNKRIAELKSDPTFQGYLQKKGYKKGGIINDWLNQ